MLTNITWFITFTLTITWIPNKSFIAYSFINQFFTFTFAFISIPSLSLQTLATSLHLQVSWNFMCLISLVFDIRLNTLRLIFLTSGTHNFANGSLILLQLPLHLLVLILKRKNTGSSLLTVTISSLILHSWLFIETQFNAFTGLPLINFNQKHCCKKYFLRKPKYFILYLFFFH